MAVTLPRIAVIGTGGTISSLGADSLDVLDYPDFGQKLTSEGLLEKFPETRLVAEPVPVTFRQVGSTAIGPDGLGRIARHDPPHRPRGSRHRRLCHPARHRDLGGDRVLSEPDARASASRSCWSGRSGRPARSAPMPG